MNAPCEINGVEGVSFTSVLLGYPGGRRDHFLFGFVGIESKFKRWINSILNNTHLKAEIKRQHFCTVNKLSYTARSTMFSIIFGCN